MRAVKMGDGDAAVRVGYCHQYGIGTRRNPLLARHMFRRALTSRDISDLGREEAMYHLAVSFVDEGNIRLALPLLKRAAKDEDYSEAMSLLNQIRSMSDILPCRCCRDIYKDLPGMRSAHNIYVRIALPQTTDDCEGHPLPGDSERYGIYAGQPD